MTPVVPYPAPDTFVEWFRLASSLLGMVAFGLLLWRLIGRWPLSSRLSKCIISLLSVACLTLGLNSARNAEIHAPFNEIGILAAAVNACAVIVALFWHHLDPYGRYRHNRDAARKDTTHAVTPEHENPPHTLL